MHIINFYDFLSKEHQIKRCKGHKNARVQKPLSSKTMLEHHRLLRAMFQKAVYWQIIISNPLVRVQPPRSRRAKIQYYDDEECKLLLEKLKEAESKYKAIVLLTLFTGVRRGELLGLEWSDIDLKEGYVNIDKASQYLGDKGIFTKDPKTESSVRGVAIPQFIIDVLNDYKLDYEKQKEKCGDKWLNSNRLFVQ